MIPPWVPLAPPPPQAALRELDEAEVQLVQAQQLSSGGSGGPDLGRAYLERPRFCKKCQASERGQERSLRLPSLRRGLGLAACCCPPSALPGQTCWPSSALFSSSTSSLSFWAGMLLLKLVALHALPRATPGVEASARAPLLHDRALRAAHGPLLVSERAGAPGKEAGTCCLRRVPQFLQLSLPHLSLPLSFSLSSFPPPLSLLGRLNTAGAPAQLAQPH